jgi:hypothetical protein
MTTQINDFDKCLEYSQSTTNTDFVHEFIKDTFATLDNIERVDDDMDLQRRGIDIIVHLDNGNKIRIDEKIRKKWYGDILLEEYSVLEDKKWGWLSREKYTDYIIYCCPSAGKGFLLPFQLLQLAWLKNYKHWRKEYGVKKAKNNGYTTTNIPVPVDVVFNAINEQMKIEK